MRDDDLLWGKRPRGRRVEPVSFKGDPPGLRKHEQGVIHTLGLVAMCTPFVFFALHVEPPPPEQKPAGPPEHPAVPAKAVVPTTPVRAEKASADENPSYFDENAASRVVLRRILFVPADDQEGSEKMDVLYDIDTEKRTVQIEEGEAIRGSVERH